MERLCHASRSRPEHVRHTQFCTNNCRCCPDTLELKLYFQDKPYLCCSIRHSHRNKNVSRRWLQKADHVHLQSMYASKLRDGLERPFAETPHAPWWARFRESPLHAGAQIPCIAPATLKGSPALVAETPHRRLSLTTRILLFTLRCRPCFHPVSCRALLAFSLQRFVVEKTWAAGATLPLCPTMLKMK